MGSLEALIKAGMKEEYLQTFDLEKSSHFPTAYSVLWGLALHYFADTGALIDHRTLLRSFQEGAAELLGDRLGLTADATRALAQLALKTAYDDQHGNGSDVRLLVEQSQEIYESGRVMGLLQRGAREYGKMKPRTLLTYLVDEAHKIQSDGGQQSPSLSVKQTAEKRIERYERIVADPTEAQGWLTGFTEYDRRTGGLYPGEVVLVTGITKLGKSLFRDKVLSNIWLSGHSVVTILSEFYGAVAQTRIECMALAELIQDSGDPNYTISQALKRGRLGERQKQVYYQMLRSFRELPGDFHFIEPTAYERLDELEALIAHYKARYNIAAIGVDDIHNQMLTQMRGERDDLRQGEVFNWLRRIGKRYEVAVIAEVQEDKTTAGKRMVQWSEVVKYSSKLTQKTDVGIRLYRTTQPQYPEVQVLAHRNENDSDFRFRIEMDKDRLYIADAPEFLNDGLDRRTVFESAHVEPVTFTGPAGEG